MQSKLTMVMPHGPRLKRFWKGWLMSRAVLQFLSLSFLFMLSALEVNHIFLVEVSAEYRMSGY